MMAKVYAISVLYVPSVPKHERSIKLTTFGKTKLDKSSQTSNPIHNLNREKERFFYSLSLTVGMLAVIIICSIIIGVILYVMEKATMQPINNSTSALLKFVKNIKAVYYNQESDNWNNVSFALNKVNKISRATRKVPLIVLFANETTTMDSLVMSLVYASSSALNADIPLNLENFGDYAGEIFDILKEQFQAKKVVIIRDILNINTKATNTLYDLCKRRNLLAGEAIYILIMQTDNNQFSGQTGFCPKP
ncbi:hypothetical protein RF55_1425 [Lasius niger]|uniref:Uncharacterized protein n=1 Tax=Lasius niger TaxID=67767 RepID=A0A0J7P0Q2_LASNI|nr:hypothetical protein RF55_1425 [Lasius niger]